MAQYIHPIDFLLFIFVFLIIFRIAVVLRNKNFPKGNPLRSYFVPALLLKIIGSVAFAIVYQYYYGYGDTFGYYNMGVFFTKIIKDNPSDFFKVYFTGSDAYFLAKGYVYNFDYSYNHNLANVIVARFSSFIGLFTYDNYLFTTIGFSILSFSGLWKLFRMFVSIFPTLAKSLAWCILFVPSVIFWGSGLLKDSLTLGALGWLAFACWSLFFLKKRIKSAVLIIILSIWTLLQIKAYILLSFLPALLLWIGSLYYRKISNRYVRILLWPIFVATLIFVGVQVSDLISEGNKQLNLDTIASTALVTGNSIQQIDAGSTYSLGKFAPSLSDIILKAPIALVTTLFRPFLWEVKNVVMLFSALESFLILIFTIWTLGKVGPLKALKIIFSKSIVFFCFLFSMVFSVGVAISSGNFGTLVRYKLPGMPFYLVCLLLILHYSGKSFPAFLTVRQRKKKVVRPMQAALVS